MLNYPILRRLWVKNIIHETVNTTNSEDFSRKTMYVIKISIVFDSSYCKLVIPGRQEITQLQLASYNHFHNILRLFDDLLNITFTTSETMRDCYS